jgi:hypothetical protein
VFVALALSPAACTVPAPAPATRPAPSAPADQPAPRTGFTPSPREVDGPAKEAAARFVERVGSWYPRDPPDPVARVVAAGYPAELAEVARPLLDVPADAATTTVAYPQYGGLTSTSASLIVLARQELRTDGGEVVREVLLDIRVQRSEGGRWQVTSLVDPPRPEIVPPQAGGPTPLGRMVLDDPRIDIPRPGREDIAERRVGDPILAVLASLACSYRIDVQVLVSGHPGTVFPTTRVSNHAVGRAVDVRAINDVLVVEIPRDDPVLAEFMIAAGRAGATEVGGPIAVQGRGFLTDAVHQDHVHLGITPTKPPAAPATGSVAPR